MAMALGANSRNKSFSPKIIQFASQRTDFFTIPSGFKKKANRPKSGSRQRSN